ncbi:MAG: hypothetical protein O2856_17700 [Planctomycetota bacterium]|nr:hypothetical protein [Planctomycetota bacterium]
MVRETTGEVIYVAIVGAAQMKLLNGTALTGAAACLILVASATLIAADRRRLYLAMLARCGSAADAEWLHQELTSRDVSKSLDIWLGCYLALNGEAGLPLVHSRYLENPQATFAETYAAIQALRFVRDLPGSQLSRESLILSFRLLLENNALFDLVIPDLMRLKDWESMDRLVALFKEPDAELSRVAVVNFVRACPTTNAKERLKELDMLDPEAVRLSKLSLGWLT